MLTTLCVNHNLQRRVQVDFSWVMYNQRQSSKTVMDLQCHCRVYKQLKDKFLQSIEYTNYPIHDVEFSCFGDNGPTVLSNGPQIHKHIMPAMNFDYNPHPTLYLDVEIIEVAAGQKITELDRLVNECKKTIKNDKAWRVLKDTEIAEEQLTIRELIEKQQSEIHALQADMADLKRDNDRRQKQEQASFTQTEIHKNILCDECDESVIGHRFKCTVCEDYDLCQKCEAKGLHSDHIMIRMVKSRFTGAGVDTVPSRLLPLMEKPTTDIGTEPVNTVTPVLLGSTVQSTSGSSKGVKSIPTEPSRFVMGDRLPTCLCPVNKHVSEFAMKPFEPKNFEMKMMASRRRYNLQPWRAALNSLPGNTNSTTEDSSGKKMMMKEKDMSLEEVINMMHNREDPDHIDYWRNFFATKKDEELYFNEDKDGDSDETGSTCSSDSSDSSESSEDSDSSSHSFDDLKELEESEESSEESDGEESEESENESSVGGFDVVDDEDEEIA